VVLGINRKSPDEANKKLHEKEKSCVKHGLGGEFLIDKYDEGGAEQHRGSKKTWLTR